MNKIKTTEPKVIWKLKCKLGEGTLWVKDHNSIYFVDIKKKSFFSLNIKNNKKKKYKVNKEIGFIAHVKGNIFITDLPSENFSILDQVSKNNGFASVSDNPGIGITPNLDFIKEFEVNE